MLKIYNAYANQGKIIIDDYISFKNGKFDTGLNGFGQVKSGNLSCIKAQYELLSLKYYREYLQSVKKKDGYIQDFVIWNPVDLKMIEEKYKDIDKNFETYEQYALNEEAILLFTDYIRLSYENNDAVQRIFGRVPETGMYLVMPEASLTMSIGAFNTDVEENYEVLQSKNLGRQLVLTRMNRKI